MRKLFTFFAGLLVVSTLWADAVYEPLIVASGFNRDVIAEKRPISKWSWSYYEAGQKYSYNHATQSVIYAENDSVNRNVLVEGYKLTPGEMNLLRETGWPDDNGNPGDRNVQCQSPDHLGLYWELAPYNGVNALCLKNDGKPGETNTGTLTFKNVGCFQKLYFLTFAGGLSKDSVSLTATVHYSDNTSDAETLYFYDCAKVDKRSHRIGYKANIFTGGGFFKGINRAAKPDASEHPSVYAAASFMAIDHTKLIDHIDFDFEAEKGGIAIFAVTGKTADIAAPEMKEDTEATTELVDNSFNIHWNAVAGATSYRVDVATDEDFHHMVDGYNNETVIHGTDTTISNIGSGTEYYWRVRAVNSEGGQSKSSAPKRVKTSGSPATREDANSIEAEMAVLKAEADPVDITILRTLYKDGYFNTLCLPFDLASLDGTPLAGGELYEFISATAEGENLLEINISPVPGNIVEAGKPYLIRWANTGEVLTTLVFKGVTVTTSTGQSVGEGVQFVGHIGMEQIEYENHYNLFLGENNQLYWPINDGTIMKGFRAYFAIPTGGSTPAPVRRGTPARLSIRSNVPTSVSSIQEQSNIPAKIIENGQLVIIKNGVRYNTTGQQIH